MSENDLSPARQSYDAAAGDSAGWPPPQHRQRRGRRRLFFLAALAAVAAAVAIVSSHAIPATVSASAPTPGWAAASGGSSSKGQLASAGPLSAAAIASRIDPGLVDINVTFGLQSARGAATGMVLTASGEVLTNNHVVDGATAIRVTDIGNGRSYSASVVGYERSHDLAVLQLKGASGLTTVPIGNSSRVAVGAAVTAIGNAGGSGGTPSAAIGKITALHQSITASDAGGGNAERLRGLIETDAAIQPGDSGGPLVNASGEVIAMDTAVSVGFYYQSATSQGFAIPINQVISIARRIEAGAGSSTVHIGPTAFLGVGIASPEAVSGTTTGGSPFSGALLSGVLSGSPAQHAGLAAGDVITALGGRAVGSGSALADLLVPRHPGDTVQLRWVDRSGQTHSATLRLAGGPPA